MGADVTLKGNTAFINGVETLYGAFVKANDLRGGAALVIAGLVAKGLTVVDGMSHVERGYQDFEYKLSALSADVKNKKD